MRENVFIIRVFFWYLTATFHCVQVYDVTTYLDEHPGGDDVILGATGIFLVLSYGQFSH